MSKRANAINPITEKLRKIATKEILITKQDIKKDKEKKADETDKKIIDTTWDDSAKEINQDEFEDGD
jgi:hypothetical protein